MDSILNYPHIDETDRAIQKCVKENRIYFTEDFYNKVKEFYKSQPQRNKEDDLDDKIN